MILPGLKFAEEMSLTRKEIKVLLMFIDKPKTVLEASREIGDNKGSLHNKVNLLRIKGLVEMQDKDDEGNYLYGITNIVKNNLNSSS